MSRLSFTERMAGFLDPTEVEFHQAWDAGRRAGRACRFDLTIEIDDVDRFVADRAHEASGHGHVDCDALGGRCDVQGARFNLFVVTDAGARVREMRYELPLVAPGGRELTLVGFKHVQDGSGFDVWTDTTTLYTKVLDGDDVVLTGILKISRVGFLRLLTTVSADDPRALAAFGELFLGELWKTYGGHASAAGNPAFPGVDPFRGAAPGAWVDDPDGRVGLSRRIVPFATADGNEGTLHQFRSRTVEPAKGPVLCIPGAGVRGDLFLGPPGPRSFVQHLVAAGYEVWLENWRGSIDFLAEPYTLDTVGAFDHPAAFATVLRETGRETLKVVAHCQGSTSFTITALSGLAPQVTHVVSSAVSLHTVVPRRSRLKLAAMVPLLARATPELDAQWAIRPPSPLASAIALWAKTVRRECDEPVCEMANYLYGVGPDVLWVHDQLDDETHHWVGREFSWVSTRFLRQMRASVLAGHLVPFDGLAELPGSYLRTPPTIDATWTFVAGTKNRLYLPIGQGQTHAFFDRWQPGRHALRYFDGYGHLDPLFGINAARETFPTFLAGLER